MKAEIVETDVLVIGGGSAGCGAALKAQQQGARVLMVVKGKMGRSGATPLASGISAPPKLGLPYAVLNPLKILYQFLSRFFFVPIPAYYRNLIAGMMRSHYGLVEQDYFLNLAMWTKRVFYPRLEETGLYILRDNDGKAVQPKNPLHTYVVHSHGMTGYQYGEARRKEVLGAGVPVIEEAMAFELLKSSEGEVTGALVFDYRRGRLFAVHAASTIIATGHTNWLSTRSTGTREMAANGLAMAARAGAELVNLEIQWFHAADTVWPEAWTRLHHYPNPLHGSDRWCVMRNSAGETYMDVAKYNVRMPYTIQMKRLHEQVEAGKARWDGGSYANFNGVEPAALKAYQYNWEFYEKIGLDMSKDDLECGITWHMSAGGILSDVSTLATGLPRLFVAGAAGGHMLGGIQLAAYDGDLAGASAARYARRYPRPVVVEAEQIAAGEARLAHLLEAAKRPPASDALSPAQAKSVIRAIVWDDMMYMKTEEGLRRALARLDEARREMLPRVRLRTASSRFNTDMMDALDLADMIEVCEMCAHASLTRKESRGPHFRREYPFTDNAEWLKRIIVGRKNGQVTLRLEPVVEKYVRYPRARIDYFRDPYS